MERYITAIFLFTLTILLLLLKAFNIIVIDWIWVFSPIWIPISVTIGMILVFSIFSILILLVSIVISIIEGV